MEVRERLITQTSDNECNFRVRFQLAPFNLQFDGWERSKRPNEDFQILDMILAVQDYLRDICIIQLRYFMNAPKLSDVPVNRDDSFCAFESELTRRLAFLHKFDA